MAGDLRRRWRAPGWSRCRSTSGSSAAEIEYIAHALRGARLHRAGRPRRPRRAASAPSCASSPAATSTSARERTPAGWQALRGADRAARRPSAPDVARRARGHLGADVHVGHHRPAEGRDPQPRRQRADLAGHRARHGLRRATTRRCWSCRCATRTRCTSRSRSPISAPTCVIDDRKSFDPEAAAAHAGRASTSTFTSLVPTHYIMMLDLPDAVKAQVRRRQREQAADLLGAGAPRDQARDHGALPQLAAVRALRLDRGRLGDAAAARRAAHQARLGRPRVDGLGRRSRCSTPTATRCPTARSASSTRARPTSSTATGRTRRRPPRPSAARGARSATWRAATRTATITSSTARAT